MTEEPMPMTLTIAEAAENLRISRAQGYISVGRGQLRTVKVGSRMRVLRSELETMLKQGELETEPTR